MNQKGFTLVELIITVVLLSLILLSAQATINHLSHINRHPPIAYDNQTNRSTIISTVQNDLLNQGLSYATTSTGEIAVQAVDHIIINNNDPQAAAKCHQLERPCSVITLRSFRGEDKIISNTEHLIYANYNRNGFVIENPEQNLIKTHYWTFDNAFSDPQRVEYSFEPRTDNEFVILNIRIPIYNDYHLNQPDDNNTADDIIITYFGKYHNIAGIPRDVCVRNNPIISIEPILNSVSPGGSLTYDITITNTDNVICKESNFTLENLTLPSGITIPTRRFTFNQVKPGETVTQRITVNVGVNAPLASNNIEWHVTNNDTRRRTSTWLTVFVRSVAPATPVITNPTPNQIFNAGTTSTTLRVTTNIAATCFFGNATNPTVVMATTGGTIHTHTITGLTNGTSHTRFVRCRAGSGDTISDFTSNVSVTFHVRTATPAVPTVSPANGQRVATGTTTITVTSPGATCRWGTSANNITNASGTTRTTTAGNNTLFYSCTAGSGNTISEARTGSWTYIGVPPTTVIITFRPNGAHAIGATSRSCTYTFPSTSCPITAPTITRSGWNIHGWNTGANSNSATWGVNTSRAFSASGTWFAQTSRSVTLRNMIRNGSFESAFNDNNWVVAAHIRRLGRRITGNCAHGTRCMEFLPEAFQGTSGFGSERSGGAQYILTAGSVSVNSNLSNVINPTLNHWYYGSIMFRTNATRASTPRPATVPIAGSSARDSRFEWWCNDQVNGLLTFANMTNRTNSEWLRISSNQRITANTFLAGGCTSLSVQNRWRFRVFWRESPVLAYGDSLMMIDLTTAFGAGSEACASWMDANIAWFDGNREAFTAWNCQHMCDVCG